MKITSILFLIYFFSFSTIAAELMENTLTLRTSATKKKKYKITKIAKEALPDNSGNAIVIYAENNAKCILPLQKIINVPRPKYQGCTHCMEKDEEIESFYSELFLNGKLPEVSCDILNGEAVGFRFIGRTNVKGKPMLVNQSLAFDSAVYQDKTFQEIEKEPTAIDRLLDDAAKVLLDLAF